jgi:hypothetical protein
MDGKILPIYEQPIRFPLSYLREELEKARDEAKSVKDEEIIFFIHVFFKSRTIPLVHSLKFDKEKLEEIIRILSMLANTGMLKRKGYFENFKIISKQYNEFFSF